MVFTKAPNEKILMKFSSGRFGWKYVKIYGLLVLIFLAGVFLFLYGDSLLGTSLRFLPFTPSGISFYVVAIPVILAVPVELKRRSLRYVITNYRVVAIDGVLRKSMKSIQVPSIDDVSVKQSFLDRILGHGDVIVRTEVSVIDMVSIHNPGKIQSLLMEYVRGKPTAPSKPAQKTPPERPRPSGGATASP